jgi:NADPH:quinone reductase-like Zn-dependent oxidoreductase
MAGEIVALGEGVTQWKVGDRVCANFVADLVYGDIDYAIQQSSMGGQAQGVLTQYRTFHSHVCRHYYWGRDADISRYTVPCQNPRFLELRGSIDSAVHFYY